MNVYRHSGDLGDTIAALPVIRQLGGGRLILGNVGGVGAREPMSEARYHVIAPLLQVQEYLTSVERIDDAGEITHCFHRFREKMWLNEDYNLATWQGNYFGIAAADLDLSPWLFAHPSPESNGKAVFARSARYQNPEFPWGRFIKSNPGALFVGLPEEWEAFDGQFGCGETVAYRPTADLLEVAELIAGSTRFIGNQSCAFWIACGLGHTLVQETDQYNLNSVVRRANAEYLLR